MKIAVGVDGSPNGSAALDWAIGAADAFGAEVLAVHALGLLDRIHQDQDPVPSAPNRSEIVEEFEQNWCAALEHADVAFRRLVIDGPPAMALLRAATDEGADLIVVGSRGVGGFSGLTLGSTSSQVSQHAEVPVTIVPLPES